MIYALSVENAGLYSVYRYRIEIIKFLGQKQDMNKIVNSIHYYAFC